MRSRPEKRQGQESAMNEKLKQILIPDSKSETPLYQQIADTLRSLIDNRTLCAGETIPPTRELCESFGVSAITVEAGIRRLVEESYLVRRPRRGTFVNPEPGKLPESEGKLTVRFIFGEVDLNDIYWYVVLNALERSPLIGSADKLFTSLQSGELSEARIDELVAGCAGLILCGYSSLRFAEALNRRNVPFSMIGGFRSDAAVPFDIDAVVHDDVHRAYLSTRHLIDLGHRDICCVAGPGGSRLCSNIETGCRAALKDCGVPERNFDFAVVSRHSIEAGREAGLRILTRPNRPSAVFACDDRLAVGVAKAAGQLGFRIPEDLSIIGGGSQVIGKVMTPELTSTPSYPERSAALAVEKLLAQLHDPEHRKSVTVLRIDELVIGGTTRIRRPRAEEEIPARRDFLMTTATNHNGKG